MPGATARGGTNHTSRECGCPTGDLIFTEENMLRPTTDVLIVGAGPTGLALAITLQQAGIDYILIDKLPNGQNTSRAAVIHAHTLEMLDELGVSTLLVEEGLKLNTFSIRDRDRTLVQLRFDGLSTPHPYLLMLPQDVTERIMADRLVALGGVIHRGVAATEVRQDATGAHVSLTSDAGTHSVTARYLVGGDGMHSLVRAAAGAEFEGAAYGESFVLADVSMEWSHGRDDVMLFFSPAGLVVVAPLPNGHFRIVATLDGAPEQPTITDIQSLIDARGPTTGRATVTEVAWSSRFRVHHRLAKSYRNERLLLMGDAAHVHSPAGGQGMNTGLVDACVLGRLLTAVVAGKQPASMLDQYQDLRRPAAEKVLGLAGRLTVMATMRNPVKRQVRNLVFSLINRLSFVKHVIAMNLSGLSRRQHAQIVG
jgi:2-polyprenyl-6-methoxyphenol hydroxylase-like FAD-dependent oxidoreductase